MKCFNDKKMIKRLESQSKSMSADFQHICIEVVIGDGFFELLSRIVILTMFGGFFETFYYNTCQAKILQGSTVFLEGGIAVLKKVDFMNS